MTKRGLNVFFVVAFVVAAVLRLTWTEDMEYKGDERFMFGQSQVIGVTEPWPELGMPSGVGLRNPGMSIWIFAILAKVVGAKTPLALDQAIIFMNIGAFALLILFAYRIVPAKEREAWLWAGALAAVSPLAVLLQRKIWAQSVLPIFCVLFLIGWFRRDRYWGAILWGIIGAVLGQIHMSGFFFAAGFVLFAAVLGQGRPVRARWLGWLAGSALGAITLLPWIRYVLTNQEHGPPFSWSTVLTFRFFRYWLSDALGLGLDYSLGGRYLDFLRYPLLFTSKDFYPALYLHGVAMAVGALILIATLIHGLRFASSLRSAWRSFRACSETTFTLFAAFFGYGLLLTFAGVLVWRHYMLVTFPLEWLSFSFLALAYVRRPRRALFVLWVTQLALSITFLGYIHDNHGAPDGDYGPTYKSQGGL